MTGRDMTPPDSPELVDYARQNPGSWLYEIDPFFDPDGEVPSYGVVGAWSIDEEGGISDTFQENSNYRPSPRGRGFPEPTDELDAAIQLAVTGYGPEDQAVARLLSSEVLVAASPEEAEGSLWVHEIDGVEAVLVFTSEQQLPGRPLLEGSTWRTTTGTQLAASVPDDVDVVINLTSPARWLINGARLRPPRATHEH